MDKKPFELYKIVTYDLFTLYIVYFSALFEIAVHAKISILKALGIVLQSSSLTLNAYLNDRHHYFGFLIILSIVILAQLVFIIYHIVDFGLLFGQKWAWIIRREFTVPYQVRIDNYFGIIQSNEQPFFIGKGVIVFIILSIILMIVILFWGKRLNVYF